MSDYVGIDVHRKRSHVAVIDQDGGVLANRNAPNGVQPTEGATGTLHVATVGPGISGPGQAPVCK